MSTAEAHQLRHIVGRVFRGQTLRAALESLAAEHGLRSAWLSAVGAFEWIELVASDQAELPGKETRRLERCELLSMQGSLSTLDGEPSWELYATLSVRRAETDVTVGGRVVDGGVLCLELRVVSFDDVELSRSDDPATRWKLGAVMERVEVEGAQPAPVTWAMAAEMSASAEPSAAQPRLERGDWIDHHKFGLCRIDGLSGEGVCVIKLPDARRKKIKVDAMRVLPPRMEGGRRVFPVRPKPRG